MADLPQRLSDHETRAILARAADRHERAERAGSAAGSGMTLTGTFSVLALGTALLLTLGSFAPGTVVLPIVMGLFAAMSLGIGWSGWRATVRRDEERTRGA